MECREYIENYLAAHADGELDPAERRAADAHIDGCERPAGHYSPTSARSRP